MKPSVYQSLLFALLFATAMFNLQADPVQDLKQTLSSGDPSARASAMQNFVISLGTVNGRASMEPAIPILVSALSDSDAKVRQSAATGLMGIAAVTSRMIYPTISSGPDLTADPSTQQALLKATSDPDPQVRQIALQAYGVTYKLTPDVEQKIIDTFNSYQPTPGQPDTRFALLGSLVNDRSPSPTAANFIAQKIDDPQFGIAALQSLASLKQPPADVLPRLLSELSQPNLSEARKLALIAAIKAYGPSAQAQLRQMLANDKDPQVQQALQPSLAPAPNPVQPPASLPSAETTTSPPSTPPVPTVAPSDQIVASAPTENGGGVVVPVLIIVGLLAAAFILYRMFIAKKS